MPQVSYRTENQKSKSPRFFKRLFSSKHSSKHSSNDSSNNNSEPNSKPNSKPNYDPNSNKSGDKNQDENQKSTPNTPDLAKSIKQVENTSLKSSSFLNHLLKDYQFIVKLSEDDVTAAKTDIDYLKSSPSNILKEIQNSIKEEASVDTNGIVELLNKTEADLLAHYIDSTKRLSKTISASYKKVREKERGINDYSFIELIARLSEKSAELKSSKTGCINTLKLKVGDNFGYHLQLNIVGAFTDPQQARRVKEINNYSFLYPINYTMIMNGEMLPDVKLIKSHLFKIKSLRATKIESITILNDPYDELEKILPVTEILKSEISLSSGYINKTEEYIEASITTFIKNGHTDINELRLALKTQIEDLNNQIELTQNDRISLSEEAMHEKLPKVDQKNYVTLNSFIYRRLVVLQKILATLDEAYSRNITTVHPFNLDVLEASLMNTANICKLP